MDCVSIPYKIFLSVLTFESFCHVIGQNPLKRDALRRFEDITLRLLDSFFDWMLSQRVGEDGRRLRGIRKKSTLETYWKVYRLVYERATGSKIGGQITRQMHRVGATQGNS